MTRLWIRSLALPAVVATGWFGVTSWDASATAVQDSSAAEDDDHADWMRKRDRRLKEARLDLEIARLGVEAERLSADGAVLQAEREHREAGEALEAFRTHERPSGLEKAAIALRRAEANAEHAQDELNELVAMYEAEEFAEMTKELVLKRGRHQLEVAQRELALRQSAMKFEAESALPRKEAGLVAALEHAERGLRRAQLGREKTALEARRSLWKAEVAISEIEEEKPPKKEKKEKKEDEDSSESSDEGTR